MLSFQNPVLLTKDLPVEVSQMLSRKIFLCTYHQLVLQEAMVCILPARICIALVV